ncbi:hypothetical protein KAX02_08720 [candidate division WOR-3 bacterium]|nr:hypothetical protein [candidate division WOR-3 bacterium]
MDIQEESKILVAIAKLETKYNNLDEDVKTLTSRIDQCMTKNEECVRKNFQYIITTLIAAITALFGWGLLLKGII